jgi:hypothetical protein
LFRQPEKVDREENKLKSLVVLRYLKSFITKSEWMAG